MYILYWMSNFMNTIDSYKKELQKEFHFYVWNESKNEVRLTCSFNTNEAEVEAFAHALSGIKK